MTLLEQAQGLDGGEYKTVTVGKAEIVNHVVKYPHIGIEIAVLNDTKKARYQYIGVDIRTLLNKLNTDPGGSIYEIHGNRSSLWFELSAAAKNYIETTHRPLPLKS